jgi:hypothetical protein
MKINKFRLHDLTTKNDLVAFINKDERVFICCGETDEIEWANNSGYITLDKDDVRHLIKELNKLFKEML